MGFRRKPTPGEIQMKRLFTSILAIVVLIAVSGVVVAEEKPASCLHPMFVEWADALKAGDLEVVLGLYAGSSEVLAVESKGNVRKGPEGIRQMYVDAFKEVDFETVEVEPMQVHLEDDTGFCYFVLRSKTTVKEDKSHWELHIQGTWLVKKVKGEWKILVEHFSPLEGVPRVKNLDEAEKPENRK